MAQVQQDSVAIFSRLYQALNTVGLQDKYRREDEIEEDIRPQKEQEVNSSVCEDQSCDLNGSDL